MYGLTWTDGTLTRLVDIYVEATVAERERMADGVEAFNARLRDNPEEEGESREPGFRLAFPPLLAVGFFVSETDRHVFVVRVQRYGR